MESPSFHNAGDASANARDTQGTTESDGDLDLADHVRVHWWALCVVLNVLRGEARPAGLAYLLGPGHIVDALLQTLTRWHRFHAIATLLAWILKELAKESADLREELRRRGFYKLLKITRARHAEIHSLYRDLGLVLDLIGDATTAADDKVAEAIGDLELPLLDADASAYRGFALHPDLVGVPGARTGG